MVDCVTRERIVVEMEGSSWPYIMLPVDQAASVTALLRENHVSFWVDSHSVSLNGKPAVTVITLGRGTDVQQIQRRLDSAG